ncbi:hypothetical protein Ciccas_008569 [Cichlidogyrus casuarinus]|uniref:Ig-like domain-containing protein n=1 Tax=Cichlidogyrus casuarinus TaxID=1844966 RepID=A0ABD2Q274_9PLAT
MQRYAGRDYQLKINRAKPEDAGEYTVRAENSFGKAEVVAKLMVEAIKVNLDFGHKEYKKRHFELKEVEMFHEEEYAARFTFQLRNRYIQEGQSVKLICTVDGHPSPTYSWYKDGHELVRGRGNYEIESMQGMTSLELFSCSVNDAGRYTCKAKNARGEDETSCKIFVEQNRWKKFLSEKTDECLRVTRASSTQPTSYSMTTRTSHSATRRSSRHDNYSYEVTETYSSTRTERSASVRESSKAPVCLQKLSTETFAKEGQPITIEAKFAEASPVANIKWTLEDRELRQDNQTIITTSADASTSRLILKQPLIEDTGILKCLASNSAGNASTQTTLIVQGFPIEDGDVVSNGPVNGSDSLPKLVLKNHLQSLTVQEGEEVSLKVDFSQDITQACWSLNGKNLADERYAMTVDGSSASLKVAASAAETDSGIYTCTVDKCSTTCMVQVLSSEQGPHVTKFPQSKTLTGTDNSTDLELSFNQAVSKVECRMNETDKVMNGIVIMEDGTGAKLSLQDLKPSDSGCYTIVATTDDGQNIRAAFALQILDDLTPVNGSG